MTGCTPLLCNLLTTSPEKLVKADPAKIARKYGIDHFPWAVEWVRMSLAHHRGRG